MVNPKPMKQLMSTSRNLSLSLVLALALIPAALSADEATGKKTETQALSLITATPEEGFQVALRLARLAVTEVQSDREVLKEGRKKYSRDPGSLIATSQVVAIHFQTVAAANNYWRDTPAKGNCTCGDK